MTVFVIRQSNFFKNGYLPFQKQKKKLDIDLISRKYQTRARDKGKLKFPKAKKIIGQK